MNLSRWRVSIATLGFWGIVLGGGFMLGVMGYPPADGGYLASRMALLYSAIVLSGGTIHELVSWYNRRG